MSVEVIFTNFLVKLVNGRKKLNYNPGKLSEILKEIGMQYPLFKKEVFDIDGNLKDHILLFIDDKNYRELSGIDTTIKDNQKIKIYLIPMGG